jgi:hypothetical protein
MKEKSAISEVNKCPKCGAIGNRLSKIKVMFFCANCLIHFDYRGNIFVVTPNGRLIKESRLKKEDETMAYGDKMKLARELLPKDTFIKLMESGKTDDQIAADHKLEDWQVKKLKRQYGLVQPRKKDKPQAAKITGQQPVSGSVTPANKPAPPKDLLETMVLERVSRKEIATYFGSKVAHVDEWMNHYGLSWPGSTGQLTEENNPEPINNTTDPDGTGQVSEPTAAAPEPPPAIIHYAGTEEVIVFPNLAAAFQHVEENCSAKEARRIDIYQKVPFTFGVTVKPTKVG